MGRRRRHDDRTREELLAAAEQLVGEGGADALSTRSVAVRAGTTTRAVYTVFGSKDTLLQALAQRAFQLIIEQVDSVPLTADPGEDLVTGAVQGFRVFALAHPDLFRLVFGAAWPGAPFSADTAVTQLNSYERLIVRVQRAQAAGLLGDHSIAEVALLWDAICTGLAAREICGMVDPSQAERIWTDALRALLAGLGSAPLTSRTPSTRNVD
jgi:AcrR family transcriptional regulator